MGHNNKKSRANITNGLHELDLGSNGHEVARPASFLLIDENELMQVETSEDFALKLGCTSDTPAKVVSIFGTIGHGKSYTLNNTFYDCQDVFQTSSTQDSCTIGIWAAFEPKKKVITLDTEGLLGVSANCQRRTRLLLKVLSISDIVIYRTKSERLEDNLFTFLGDASRVYVEHFFKEMQNAFQRMQEFNGHQLSELGPMVIIFQETRDTEPLKQEANQTRESIIRSRFKTLGLKTEAFSAIEYVGIQTQVRPTNFDLLKQCIKKHIKSSSARAPRPISVIHATLKVLNEKFNGDVEKTVPSMFNQTLLTCPVKCLSCNARCINSMNHHRDGAGHSTDSKCVYQHQFNNHSLYCRACHERGEEVIVTPRTYTSNDAPLVGLAKYAWAGCVLECPRCGVINRSRQYWFGNKETWESTVRTEIKHVWPGELNKMQAAQNAAQRVLDSVSYITETVTSISAKPTKMVSEWVADQIAPNYWIPNSRILHCALCNSEFGQFDQKHHCRLCGNGLCSTCSSKSKPVPERGWGETSVRVCDRCYERSDHLSAISSLPPLPVSFEQQQQQQEDENQQYQLDANYAKELEVDEDNDEVGGGLAELEDEEIDEELFEPVASTRRHRRKQSGASNLDDTDRDDEEVAQPQPQQPQQQQSSKKKREKAGKDSFEANHEETTKTNNSTKPNKKQTTGASANQTAGASKQSKQNGYSKQQSKNNSNSSKKSDSQHQYQNGTSLSSSSSASAQLVQVTSSSSIPIPKTRTQGSACSNNITPTQHSSSSAESSSSLNNNHSNHDSLLNGTNVVDMSPSTSRSASYANSPVKTNGLAKLLSNGDFCSEQQQADANCSDHDMFVNGSPLNNFTGFRNHHTGNGADSMITARKFGEVLQNTLKSVVSTAIDYPLGVIKDSARPEYWTPDAEITNCGLCKADFNELITIHHCRRCGGGFCNECSAKQKLVPERGWGETRVRVCNKCYTAP